MMLGRSDAQLKANIKTMEFQRYESLLLNLSLHGILSYTLKGDIPDFLHFLQIPGELIDFALI